MTLLPVSLAAASIRASERADPLAAYTCKVWAQRDLIAALASDPPVECLWHAGNSGGKTTGGLATDLAFLQGRGVLTDTDGSEIRLPIIKPPVAWLLGVPSYRVAAGSSLPKLRELLGSWPYHEAHAGGPDQVSTFMIRHRQSRDDEKRSDWSRLYVFPYEGEVPEALRLDGWHCDEPPPMRFLDALRNRGKAGRPLRGFLTLTPIERKHWEPIFADFPTTHRRTENHRLRLQSSVYDNKALTPADITRAEDAVRTSPYRVARLYGDPVDIAGTCPFDTDELVRQRDLATEGARFAVQWVNNAGRDALMPVQNARGMLESWGWPGQDDLAILVADPSSGVKEPDKPDHLQPRNPSGLLALSLMGRCDLLRFNGYVRAHELGNLARAVTNRCPNWLMVHETNGGWGDAFLRGFNESPGITRGELWFERDPITGKMAAEPGWRQSTTALGMLMSALQRATEMGGLTIHSRAAIDHLLRTRLDSNERWDRGDGKGPHGEDVILYGIGAYLMERTTLPRKSEIRRTDYVGQLGSVNGHAKTVRERW